MGKYSIVDIQDFSDANSVIQPILKTSEEKGAPSLQETMENVNQRFRHERFFAGGSHDVVGHI